jgi:hypothetical protein
MNTKHETERSGMKRNKTEWFPEKRSTWAYVLDVGSVKTQLPSCSARLSYQTHEHDTSQLFDVLFGALLTGYKQYSRYAATIKAEKKQAKTVNV